MKATATLRFARTSPRKARLVANLIRGMHVREAEVELKYLNKKAAQFFADTLKSAVSNAENNHSMNPANLVVSEVVVNEGPFFKRFQPRAFGRAYPILKKTSHITVTVSEKKRDVKKAVEEMKEKKAKADSKNSEKKTPVKKTEKKSEKKAAPAQKKAAKAKKVTK